MLGSLWRWTRQRRSHAFAPAPAPAPAPEVTPVSADRGYVSRLVDRMDVGVVACDVAGRLTAANQFARHLYGADDRAGMPVERWASAVDVFDVDGLTPLPERLPLARVLRDGPVRDIEFVIAPRSGPRRTVVAHGRTVRAPDGTPQGAVVVLHDITRLRDQTRALRAENAELQRANAALKRSVAELETFAGVVSHDLKSPLITVAGYVQLLSYLDPGQRRSADYDDFLAKIAGGVDVMRTLIDDMLAFATAPEAELQLTEVDLDELVKAVVAARTDLCHLADADGPQPEITVDPLPTVVADRAMLRQVMDNLVGNAIKYTAPGQAAQVRVSAAGDAAGRVQIEVVDRGIGIPDGKHDAVFQRFHRAHWDAGYPGNGLGLTICQLIVERHGGLIGAQPNPGGGTRFWLTLPASKTSAPPVCDANPPVREANRSIVSAPSA